MILIPKNTVTETNIPIDAECISPDVFDGKSTDEIKNLPVLRGNRHKKLADFFDVLDNNTKDIEINGDVTMVKNIGSKMSRGKITITGNCGMHLGAEMTGGEIIVNGNVSDWAGAEMKGGIIRINGNCGNFLGSGYRGSAKGMENGIISVKGSAGNNAGTAMYQGTIVISGNCGDYLGAYMTGGTIYCFGNTGKRAGAELKDGTIVVCGNIDLMPTFKYNSSYNPVFLRFFLNELKKYEIPVDDKYINGIYKKYSGDLAESEKGELFIFSH